MSLQTNNIYEFEDFRLDFTEKTLRKEGSIVPLTPKVFETLLIFLENPGRLIEKDELMQKLWQDRFVEESNLTFNIKMLRKALGDNAQRPQFIETVQSRGYRFIAEVRRIEVKEKGRKGEGENNGLASVSFSPLLPVSSSQKGAVVALAEWKHAVDTKEPEELDEHIAKLELVPTKPVIKSRPKYLALIAAGIVLGAIGLGYYFLNSGGGEAIDSVAVLPFVNTTGDTNTEYLSDGISDSIINSLSRLPNLKVNSLNSVMRYKGKEVDAQTIGRELNVKAVLIGKLTPQGDDVTISVELVDVRDNRRLWGEQYNRKLSDILVVQGEIARQISDGLRLRLSGDEQKQLAKQYTNSAEAYQLYILGKYLSRQMTKEGFEKGIEYFEQAIKIDPSYALAYTELAGAYQFMMSRGFLPPKEHNQKIEWAALKALQIDDTLAEAHASLGAYKIINFDWAGAEKDIRRALELDPNSSKANSMYAHYLLGIGRTDEFLRYSIRAGELESMPRGGEVAFAYYMARQYDKAIESYRKNLEKNPNNAYARIVLGETYVANGTPADGVAEMEKGLALDKTLDKTPERWDRYPLMAYAYAAAGRRDDALKILKDQQELANERYVSPYNFAIIYTALGDKDRAFEWLTKSVEERIMIIYHLKSRPLFDSLRSDPRYPELLRKMNLTP
jgi:TolB-like protein/DNA-binding winged helix-turn-helix (wHTH) protein/Flp pilus assembly protein TadD